MNSSNLRDFSGIYGITDDALLPAERLCPAVEAALRAGVRLIQYRSKSPDERQRLEQARKLQALCAEFAVPLIINDDVDLCRKVGAAGVHLGDDDPSLEQARDQLGEHAIIGISCHASVESAALAEAGGADYVAFGRFYPSRTKPGAGAADPAVLTEAGARLGIPVVAIGGINADNGAALIAAGADMLAVVDALFGGEDIDTAAARLVALYN